MEFWLKTPHGDIHFPVPPENFEVEFGSMNKVITVANFGEVSLSGGIKLREWNIDSFFPLQDYNFCQYHGFRKPYEICKLIDQNKYEGNICRFIVTGTRLNNACTIEEFRYGERDASGDVYFSLTFREHRIIKPDVRIIKNKNKSKGKGKTISRKVSTRTTRAVVKSYKIKKGDTLSLIAKKVYGNSSNWSVIAKKNKLKNPNAINVGQVLLL